MCSKQFIVAVGSGKSEEHNENPQCHPTLRSDVLDQDGLRADLVYLVKNQTQEKKKLYFACQEQVPIEELFEKGELKLKDLCVFGEELITNIRVSNERYELMRRRAEEISKNDLDNIINDESKITLAKFDEIVARWSELQDVKEPMALFEELEELKNRISLLMSSKRKIIARCQNEYELLTKQYQADEARHEITMCSLVERIDNHIEIMNHAYKEHIETLAIKLDDGRRQQALTCVEEWNNIFEGTMQSQREKQLLKRQKQDYYDGEIKRITKQKEEMTHTTRVRLEKDAELLQLELRTAHNNALLNSEKLDYNYNVLEKSSLEKTLILNQQKRRIAKLSEHIVLIKKQINEHKVQSEGKIKKAVADIEKLHSSISQLEQKSLGLQKHQREQYIRCWDMNYNEAVTLINRIFTIDKTIYEQLLLVPWPSREIESNYVPKKSFQKFKTSRSSTKADTWKNGPAIKQRKEANMFIEETETRLVRHVLRTLPDRMEFLIESPLLTVLKSQSEKHRKLIKVNNVYSVLKIDNINDMRAMAKYFKRYMFCSNCTINISDQHLNEALGKRFLAEDNKENDKDTHCQNHCLVMDPAFVLSALNEFINDHGDQIEAKQSKIYSETASKAHLHNLTRKEIEDFWTKILANVPKSRGSLWKCVEHGLNHYMEVLKKREQLFKECNTLKRQNFELIHFLKRFQ